MDSMGVLVIRSSWLSTMTKVVSGQAPMAGRVAQMMRSANPEWGTKGLSPLRVSPPSLEAVSSFSPLARVRTRSPVIIPGRRLSF